MLVTEHMRVDPAYAERLRAAGLDTVERVLAWRDGRVAAWSRTTDTIFVPSADDQPGFYVKRHFFPRWSNRLRGTFRGTYFGLHRGQAEYLALNAMRSLGIPAVRAIAYGGRRVAHFLSACFLITEEVPDAFNLTTFATQVLTGRRTLDRAARGALIRALAAQLVTMHGTGVSHGNLFWRNILVRGTPDAQPEFFFLDAQPLRIWERLRAGGQWWTRELAQVTVSALAFTTRTERLRFFCEYFDTPRLTPTLKDRVRQIERLARTWRGHEQRRIHMNRLFDEWNRQLSEQERKDQPRPPRPEPAW